MGVAQMDTVGRAELDEKSFPLVLQLPSNQEVLVQLCLGLVRVTHTKEEEVFCGRQVVKITQFARPENAIETKLGKVEALSDDKRLVTA